MAGDWVDRAEWPYERRTARVADGSLHYVDVGQGPVVLFAHGTPTWSFEWRHLIADLSRDHRCVAPDHLGFGLSDRPAGADYSPEAHARRYAEFVDGLGLSDFTLVVHDFGGPIALPLALAGRARRLVVLNSWMWAFEDPAMVRLARLTSGWLGRQLYVHANASLRLITPSAYGDRRKLTKAIHAQYLAPFAEKRGREEVLFALARSLLGSSAHYASLWDRRSALARVPSLVVWGLKDSAFKPPVLARWREALPHARMVELAGAGHWPHEEEPAAVVSAIRGFLSE